MNLLEFAAECAAMIEEIADDDIHAAIFAEDVAGESVVMGSVGKHVPADEVADHMTALVVGQRKFAALANRTYFSYNEGPSFASWLLICVEATVLRPAEFWVKQDREQQWTRLRPYDMEWFAASTASALRALLLEGKRPVMREATKGDPRLFSKVRDRNPPAAHPDGTI